MSQVLRAVVLTVSAVVAQPVAACVDAQSLCLNELLVQTSGSQANQRPHRYIELRGPAGSTIAAGTRFLVIDGDRQNNRGNIDSVLDLSGRTFGANGYLVLLAQGAGYAVAPQATVETSSASGFSGLSGWTGQPSFERPSATYLLIHSTVAPVADTDIDTNDDGIPEAPFTDWTVLDSIGIADHQNDRTYAALNFRTAGTTPPAIGTTLTVPGRIAYLGRFGDSFGSTASAWVASGAPGGATFAFTLNTTNITPAGLGGKPLNHVGSSNQWANAAPAWSAPANASGLEDVPLVFAAPALPLSASDADAAAGIVRLSASVGQGRIQLASVAGLAIVSGANDSAAITVDGTLADINSALDGLQYTGNADWSGTDMLDLLLDDHGNTGTDGARTASVQVPITLAPVNDPPSFLVQSGHVSRVEAGPQSVPGFASMIQPGPADESAQAVQFEITANDAPALFASAPAILPDGTLAYTAGPDAGTATIGVRARDNGGTADGGIDVSGVATFTITIDPPLTAAQVSAFTDDDGDDLLALNQAFRVDVDVSRTIDGTSVATSDFAFSGSGSASIDGVVLQDANTVRVSATATGGGTLVLGLVGEIRDHFGLAVATANDDTTLVVDATFPEITAITRLDADPSNAASVRYGVTYSEAVTGVDAADFEWVGSGVSGASVTSVSGSGTQFAVLVGTGTGDGTLGLRQSPAAVLTDIAGNSQAASTVTTLYSIDRTAPQVASITLLDANPAQWPFVRFRVDFDEAVAGFGIEDVAPVLGGGAADAMILDVAFAAGHHEVLVYTGLADGTVGLEVLAGASVADAAGNPLAAGLVGPSSYQLDSSLLIPLFRNGFE